MTQPVLGVVGGLSQGSLLTDDGNVLVVRGVPIPLALLAPLAPATPQGNLFIDPQNVSGGAGTGPGFGTSASSPLLSYAALAQQWGTLSPVLNTSTTLTWLSSVTDGSDPVICRPIIRGTTNPFLIQGAAPTLVANVTLSGVVPKSRAAGANSLLQATLGTSAAQGLLLENLTHPSRAWVYTLVSGTTWNISQPLTKATIGGSIVLPEVDTWANGDSVQILQPVAVNIVDLEPTYTDIFDAVSNNEAYLYNLIAAAPIANSVMYLGDVRVHECRIDRFVQGRGASPKRGLVFSNVDSKAGWEFMQGAATMFAGVGRGSSITFSGGALLSIDFDHIVGALYTVNTAFTVMSIAFLDANVQISTGRLQISVGVSGGAIIYGSAGHNILLQGNARASQTAGTFVATFTAPALISPGISLNGASTGHSVTSGTPDVFNGGIATTPANLDAAAGAAGFGGNAFNPGGASVANVA